MNIRIANAPVSWGIMEVEEWSAPLPYTTFMDELRGAGYDGTELGPYGYMPVDPGELEEALRARSLALVSGFVPLRLKDRDLDLEPLQAVGRLLNTLGAEHIVLADMLWPEREAVAGRAAKCGVRLSKHEWKVAAANIGRACGAVAGLGLHCVFHNYAGTYIETPDEVERLLDLTDIGLCLDTGHYVYGGGDPVEAVRALGDRVEYLHFKDADSDRLDRARCEKLGFLDGVRAGVFCGLGRGCVRFKDLLAELEEIDYAGWVVVEQDVDLKAHSGPSPAQCAKDSREYLRDLLGI